MQISFTKIATVVYTSCCLLLVSGAAALADDAKGNEIVLGKLTTEAPKEWKKQQPRVRIIAYEFSVPAAGEDKKDGRFTIMAAGGSLDANIDRWIGQFTQPDGGSTKERTKTEQIKVGGNDVHLVDISGTFKDQAGPFAPAVNRPGYRMLAAIVVTPQANFFLKFYGPQRTVADNAKAFKGVVEGLK